MQRHKNITHGQRRLPGESLPESLILAYLLIGKEPAQINDFLQKSGTVPLSDSQKVRLQSQGVKCASSLFNSEEKPDTSAITSLGDAVLLNSFPYPLVMPGSLN